MTKYSTISAIAVFFLATNLLVCVKTQGPDISSTTSTITTDIEPLPAKHFGITIRTFLSPTIFSEPDPLAFFLDILTKSAYNSGKNVLAYVEGQLKAILAVVDYHMENRKFPLPYQPYARLLSSLLTCLIKLHQVSKDILEIQQIHSAFSDYPPPTMDILTPELRDLFAKEVFSDSKIPSALLKKILEIPDDRMRDVMADLVKLSNTRNNVEPEYFEYMNSLRIFFENRDDLLRLRNVDAEIRQNQNNKNKTTKTG